MNVFRKGMNSFRNGMNVFRSGMKTFRIGTGIMGNQNYQKIRNFSGSKNLKESVPEWIHTFPEYIHSSATFLIVLIDNKYYIAL